MKISVLQGYYPDEVEIKFRLNTMQSTVVTVKKIDLDTLVRVISKWKKDHTD